MWAAGGCVQVVHFSQALLCVFLSRYTRHMYLYLYVADVSVSVCKFLRLSVCLTVCLCASSPIWVWALGCSHNGAFDDRLVLVLGAVTGDWKTYRFLKAYASLPQQRFEFISTVCACVCECEMLVWLARICSLQRTCCCSYCSYMFKLSEVPSIRIRTHTHIMPVFVCVQMVFFQRPRSALL